MYPCPYLSCIQSCLTLCGPMDCSPPGSSVHGIFQARILEQVDISYSRWSSWPRIETWVSSVSLHWQVDLQCLGSPPSTLFCCSIMSYSFIPWTVARQAPLSMGILQARILERVVMPSSRGSSWPRDWNHIFCGSWIADGFSTLRHWGSPSEKWVSINWCAGG